MLVRPCFLVIDTEHGGAISTRKLVLETAKYNVITAYSCEEALAQLERFPRLHAVVVNGHTLEESGQNFAADVKEHHPEVKLVIVGDHSRSAAHADKFVPSFMPAELLRNLQQLFPEQDRSLRKHEEELQAEEE